MGDRARLGARHSHLGHVQPEGRIQRLFGGPEAEKAANDAEADLAAGRLDPGLGILPGAEQLAVEELVADEGDEAVDYERVRAQRFIAAALQPLEPQKPIPEPGQVDRRHTLNNAQGRPTRSALTRQRLAAL